jgi:uncharacterized protein GlcG (DUF336 family)
VDCGGALKAFSRMDRASRMDGARLTSAKPAQDKVYTAVAFGMDTDRWYDVIKDDPASDRGALSRRAPGDHGRGYPITVGDQIVGAVGVAGGHYTQDMQVAQAGLAALD